ncbi:MAG TPA: rhomboid family intramembrane serine protease [Paludibacteraceae bacterium]|jgi:membrane associated rhomboid family serine protease|nr:rhomboid family intramembrane serine protease [Paludibacteraceae bacterium]
MNQNNPSFLDTIPPVVKNLIIINALLWLATAVPLQNLGVNLKEILALHYWNADTFRPHQIVTYMFLHGGFDHLFFNMFGLFMFGRILEYTWGPKRFLIYYMVTGIGAGLIQEITWTFDPQITGIAAEISRVLESGAQTIQYSDGTAHSVNEYIGMLHGLINNAITIGASGSIFGLLLAFGMLFPNQAIYLMFIPIPIKAKYFVIGYAVIELVLGVGNFQFDNVAHFAHLGGMLFGYFLIKQWKKGNYQKF